MTLRRLLYFLFVVNFSVLIQVGTGWNFLLFLFIGNFRFLYTACIVYSPGPNCFPFVSPLGAFLEGCIFENLVLEAFSFSYLIFNSFRVFEILWIPIDLVSIVSGKIFYVNLQVRIFLIKNSEGMHEILEFFNFLPWRSWAVLMILRSC